MILSDEEKKELAEQLQKLYNAIDEMDRNSKKIWELLDKAKIYAEDTYQRQAWIATIAAGNIFEQFGLTMADLHEAEKEIQVEKAKKK